MTKINSSLSNSIRTTTSGSIAEKRRKIRNRKPTGRKFKRKSSEEMRVVNRQYKMNN